MKQILIAILFVAALYTTKNMFKVPIATQQDTTSVACVPCDAR